MSSVAVSMAVSAAVRAVRSVAAAWLVLKAAMANRFSARYMLSFCLVAIVFNCLI